VIFRSRRPGERGRRPLTSHRIDVDGLRVHTSVAGAGPPVVLVHGFGVSGRYMLPLARSLADRFSVFVPDLPGYGRSERPRAPLDIGGLAAALAGCLSALGLERPAFVANSMGCQVVTKLAADLPTRVGRMTLIGPTVDPEQRRARHQVLSGLRDAAREPLSLLALAAQDEAALGLRAALVTVRSALADQIEDRLPLIDQPTLVLRGEADRFVSAGWAEQVARLLPRSHLVVIARQPHAAHYTRPQLVARLIAEFLLEELEQTPRQLLRGFPHRYVTAWENDDTRAGQEPLPLVDEARRQEPIALTPDEHRRNTNRRELSSQVMI
jgi:2-hydroxy-6-oxonona-2,4-dienedioate hydrolase